jgi:hypothetical protein
MGGMGGIQGGGGDRGSSMASAGGAGSMMGGCGDAQGFSAKLSFGSEGGKGGTNQVSQALQDKNSDLAQSLGLGEGLSKGQADQFSKMLKEIQADPNNSEYGFDNDPNSLSKQDVQALLDPTKQMQGADKGGEEGGKGGSEKGGSPSGPEGGQQAGGEEGGQEKLKDVNGDGKVNFLDMIMTKLAEQQGMSPEEFAKKADGNGDGKVDLKEILAAAKKGGAEGEQGEQSNNGPSDPLASLAGGSQNITFAGANGAGSIGASGGSFAGPDGAGSVQTV